jgi:CNT family concentrative nucleoside transporter
MAVVFPKGQLVKEAFLKLNDCAARARAGDAGRDGPGVRLPGRRPGAVQVTDAGATFVLAFRALPIVLVMSALSALLFYWRVLPRSCARFRSRWKNSCGVGGVVGLLHAANIFVGMVEAPLFVRPYLPRVSRGELFAIMVGGMASIAGTVLFLMPPSCARSSPTRCAPPHRLDPLRAGRPRHRLPHGAARGRRHGRNVELRSEASSSMDALTRGTLDGAQLLLNIVAMLVVFVALVALVNLVIAPYSLQGALGWALAPLAWLCGIPGARRAPPARCSAPRPCINELVAYVDSRSHRAVRAQPRPAHLRALRLRQLRQPRHHDRRPRHHVPERRARSRRARAEVDRRRHARDLPDRRDRRSAH